MSKQLPPAGEKARMDGFKEGVEARKEGKPFRSPYLGADGRPIRMLLALHIGWEMGWRAKDADLRSET